MSEGVLKATAEKLGARLQKEQSVFLSPETLISLCQTVIHTVLNNDGRYGLHVGWSGWYTRKGGERWYWCEIIAFDDGDPVIKTITGNYHRRPTHSFEFSKKREGGVSMRDREEFENRLQVPEDAIWSEEKQGYYWSNYPTVAHPFNDDWEVWQEGDQ